MTLQMNVIIPFELTGGKSIRYKFTITGNSFEEIEQQAKHLQGEIGEKIGDEHESGSIRWDPQHIEYDMEETWPS